MNKYVQEGQDMQSRFRLSLIQKLYLMKKSLIFSGILMIRLLSIDKAMILVLNIDLLSFIMIRHKKTLPRSQKVI